MSRLRLFPLAVVIFAAMVPLHAEEPATDRMAHAIALIGHGDFRAAIDLVEPLIHSGDAKRNSAVTGVAWNIRGLAFHGLEQHDEARRSFEAAIEILKAIPDQQVQYATALDNLGSVKADMGDFDESRSLRLRARQLFESLGNHAGVARTSNNLVLVAIAQGSRKDARRFLKDALREESAVATPNLGDLAEIYSAECLLDEHDGDIPGALAAVNRAINLWIQHYGPAYYMLADGYAIRGHLYDNLHDYPDAVSDMQHSLKLLAENGQTGSRVYFLTQISYAHVLRDLGVKTDAARIESVARSALVSLGNQQCRNCTISAESLRSSH